MNFDSKLYRTHEFLKKHELVPFSDDIYKRCKGCGMIFYKDWNDWHPVCNRNNPDIIDNLIKIISVDETRAMLMQAREGAFAVALGLDKCPSDETRSLVCGPGSRDYDAYEYAVNVDRCYHPVTFGRVAEGDEDRMAMYLENIIVPNTDAVRMLIKNASAGLAYAKIADMWQPNYYTRLAACKDPKIALEYAIEIDRIPRNDTRTAACMDAGTAFEYAEKVDRGYHKDTYAAAILQANSGIDYCMRILHGPDEAVKRLACENPETAFKYAKYIDRCASDETRKACTKNCDWALKYAEQIDRGPRDDTRRAACRSCHAGLAYAQKIDRKPHPLTRRAASRQGSGTGECYKNFEYQFSKGTGMLSDKAPDDKNDEVVPVNNQAGAK